MAQIVQPDRRQTQPAYSIGKTTGEPLRVQHRAVDMLAAAVQAAADAYRESHSSRGLFVPSGLRSTYRPSESEQTCRWGSLRPQPAEDILTFRGR
jgi:hypothetical protein